MIMDKLSVWLCNTSPRRWILDFVTKKYYKEYFNVLRGKKVLEIGCGSGLGARIILKYFVPSEIIATDLDERQIVLAGNNVGDAHIIFEIADAAQLNYPDHSFDAVFEYGAIHHIPSPDWQKCLREILRVLKPNGKLFIYDVSIESFSKGVYGKLIRYTSKHPYDKMFRKEEFIDYIQSVGFKLLKRKDGGRYFTLIAEKQCT